MARSREDELEHGERRVVTVLFADLVRSSEHIAQLDPDDAQEYLDGALNRMIEKIHLHGGFIAQTLGDGVMAIFGAPLPTEDHAFRACLAGIAIRDCFSQPTKNAARVRVGVHSGLVVLRFQSNDFGRELNSVGSTVHIASRVEEMCPPGSVAVSSDTAELAAAAMQSKFIGQIRAAESGNREIAVVQLIDIGPNENLDRRFLRRTPNQLVGRQSELKDISELVRSLHRGRASSMAIVGEAGIGKSRLAYEATLRAIRSNVACETLRGVIVKSDTPFAALRPLLIRLLGRGELIEPAALEKRLAGLGLPQQEALGIRSLIGGAALDSERWARLAADERNRAIVAGVTKLLLSQAKQAPMLIIVEDLHFLDSETTNLLRALKGQLQGRQLAFIVTARPEALALARSLCDQLVELGPLEPEQARQLAKSELCLLSVQAADENSTVVDAIVARAGGSPLALEEFSRMIASTLTVEAMRAQALPINLENAFGSRLGHLSVEARGLAQAASVLGNEFDVAVLRDMTKQSREEFDRSLAVLAEERFIEVIDQRSARFSHQLMQEACYGGVTKKHRQELHYSAYTTIKHIEAPRQQSHQELARHALGAGETSLALGHLWDACVEAIANAALESVVVLHRKARTLCDTIGADADVVGARFTLLVFDAFQQLGMQEELVPALERAHKAMCGIKNDRGVIQADIHLAMAHWIGGRYRKGLEHARRANDSLAGREDLPLRVYSEFTLANLEFANGEPQAAAVRFRKLIELLSGDLATARFGAMISVPGAMARAFACWSLSYLGAYDEAQRHHDVVAQMAEELDHDYTRVLSRIANGCLVMHRGDAKAAAAIFEDAHRICMSGSYFGVEPSVSAWYALALIRCGRIGLAQSVLNRSLALGNVERIRNVGRYLIHEALAQLSSGLGELDEALERIDHALSIAQNNGDLIHCAYARLTKADIRTKRGELAAARSDLTACKMEAERMGLAPLAALTSWRLALLDSQDGAHG
jgi:class 3 adenylate cyclase/tetratricopeptide (TPR) repeat protein